MDARTLPDLWYVLQNDGMYGNCPAVSLGADGTGCFGAQSMKPMIR